jgi:hypothetical protein
MNSSTPAPSPQIREGGTAETVDNSAQPNPASAQASADMPLPSDLRAAFQGGLFFLAFLAALYAAREIVLPVVLAFVLALLMQPPVRMMDRLRVPRVLSALVLIVLLLGTVIAAGTALSGPRLGQPSCRRASPACKSTSAFYARPSKQRATFCTWRKAMSAAKHPRRQPPARPRPRSRMPAS